MNIHKSWFEYSWIFNESKQNKNPHFSFLVWYLADIFGPKRAMLDDYSRIPSWGNRAFAIYSPFRGKNASFAWPHWPELANMARGPYSLQRVSGTRVRLKIWLNWWDIPFPTNDTNEHLLTKLGNIWDFGEGWQGVAN